jgi:hypothetical protein
LIISAIGIAGWDWGSKLAAKMWGNNWPCGQQVA